MAGYTITLHVHIAVKMEPIGISCISSMNHRYQKGHQRRLRSKDHNPNAGPSKHDSVTLHPISQLPKHPHPHSHPATRTLLLIPTLHSHLFPRRRIRPRTLHNSRLLAQLMHALDTLAQLAQHGDEEDVIILRERLAR